MTCPNGEDYVAFPEERRNSAGILVDSLPRGPSQLGSRYLILYVLFQSIPYVTLNIIFFTSIFDKKPILLDYYIYLILNHPSL